MRTKRLTIGALIGTTICAVAQYGSSQTLRPVDQPWTGSARCQLDIRGPGYADQQIHTWTMAGGTPTVQGAFRVYAGTWSVTGGGSWQRSYGTQVTNSRWTTTTQGVSAPMAVMARASDGAVVIQAYHGQLVARGALTGTQQVVADGRSLPATQIVADVFEWAFPTVTGTPLSTTLSGSSSPAATGSLGYLQPAGSSVTAACSWNFTTGNQVSQLSQQQPLLTQSGAQAATGTQVTLSTAGSTGSIQQVDTTTTTATTPTLATAPTLSTAVISPTTSNVLSNPTGTLSSGPAPRTITLTGFTASGSSAFVSPRTITLPGFTAAGASSVAPRTITLTGFTAAGAAAVVPRTIALTGFSATGTATVAPRTIALTGWTAAGP